MLTLDWSGDPRPSGVAAAWVVALKDDHHFPYLLHTYLNPHTTMYVHTHTNQDNYYFFPSSDLPLLLYAYTPMKELWKLVGVVGREQLLVWKGTRGLPSVTITLEGTFEHRLLGSRTTCTVWAWTCTAGESTSDLAWDPLSNTCLILDKFQQVHFFQNTTHNCSQ